MKSLTLILFLSLCVAARAGSLITATITVTNTPSDGDTITVNGSARTWKTSVATPSTQILIGGSIGANATNMWSQFASARFTTLTAGFPDTNQVTLRGIVDQTMSVSIAGTWGYYALSTNTTTEGDSVRVPMSSYQTATKATNIASQLALDLGTYSANAISNGTKLLEGIVQTNQTQTVNGTKTFTGANVYSNTTQRIAGGTLTNVTIGATNIFATNVMVMGSLVMTSTIPYITFWDSDASADNQGFDMYLSNGDLQFIVYDNSGGTLSTAMEIQRTGSTVDGVSFPYGAITVGDSGIVGNPAYLRLSAALRLDRNDIGTLANGSNAAIDYGYRAFLKLSGPTGAFSLNGIAGGADGVTLIIYNSTSQTMTIANDSGVDPTAANRILTTTGSDVTAKTATLIYDSGASRWVVVSKQ